MGEESHKIDRIIQELQEMRVQMEEQRRRFETALEEAGETDAQIEEIMSRIRRAPAP